MMYKIQLDKTAKQDILDIHAYIKDNLLSPANAVGQVRRIKTAIGKLDSFPERFPMCHSEKHTDVRMMPVDNYIVLYSVDNDDKRVDVLRIMYKRRNDIFSLNT